jgi:hypothetical protein
VFKRVSVLGDISPFWVSEGGLEHPFEWYITETVIYHQSKLTRRKSAGPAFGGQGGGGAGQSQRPGRLGCGNGGQ